jgi:hypothetical protein
VNAWADNRIQFPRLLAEIHAVGLVPKQYAQLQQSMDLSTEEIEEIFTRAEKEWEDIKG